LKILLKLNADTLLSNKILDLALPALRV